MGIWPTVKKCLFNLIKLNNKYCAIYDYYDNYVYGFEDIKDLSTFFKLPLCRILRNVRNNYCLVLDGKKYKVYLYDKGED